MPNYDLVAAKSTGLDQVIQYFRDFMEQFEVDWSFSYLGTIRFSSWTDPEPDHFVKVLIWYPMEQSASCDFAGLPKNSWRISIYEPYEEIQCYQLADPQLFPILEKIIRNYESI